MFAQLTPQQLADLLEQMKSSQGITPEFVNTLADEIFGNSPPAHNPSTDKSEVFYGAIGVRYKDSRTPNGINLYTDYGQMVAAIEDFRQNHLLAEIIVFTDPDRHIRPTAPAWILAE